MQNTISLPVSGNSRLLSQSLWRECPIGELISNPDRGIFRFERWNDLPLTPTLTTQIGFGKYKAYATTGSTVTKVSAVNSVQIQGGTLVMATDTDNDSASIADAYPSFLLNGNPGTSGRAWFEFRIAQKSVATNMAASFIGLAETEKWVLAAGVPFNAGDAITNSASAVGFRLTEDGLGVIDTVYSDRATSFTNIGAGDGGTLTAYAFTNLGIMYDPNNAAECITFWVNGVKKTNKLTRAALQAMTNLDANALGFLFATCADSGGTSHEIYCQYAAMAQLVP